MNCPDQHLQAWADRIRESFTDHPTTTLWGIWQGVFGLAAHQLITVSAHPELEDNWQRPRDCEVERQWIVKATVRPLSSMPLTRPGVYVFRDFWLPYENVDEAVSLSSAAWQTFEGAKAFSAEPMGLFAPAQTMSSSQECRLHLLTWYPDFTSWETSRQSDPEAMRRFIARRKLTRSTQAIAARLVLPA